MVVRRVYDDGTLTGAAAEYGEHSAGRGTATTELQ
jgi:hypothetical protein